MAGDADEDGLAYASEIRFGVVMYGGVSLAIYMNGVANELFEMACATPREGFTLPPPARPGTREIYRRLSWLAGNAELRRRYAQALGKPPQDGAPPTVTPLKYDQLSWERLDLGDSTQTRLVVDVISGTSAGGINGIFLAKALANGEQFAPLKDLWVNEGDIALLLNDKPSYTQGLKTALTPRSPQPTSLLNGDRMYAKLLSAMQAMDRMTWTSSPPALAGSPLADAVDLFVTTTDIRGSVVPLRLVDKVVFERRYKQFFHFAHPIGESTPSGSDFAAQNKAFLAFAARCTSSFPFAFAPMTLNTVGQLGSATETELTSGWNGFFRNLPRAEVDQGRHRYRAFGDGGYLDNKPFTYVVEALSQRFSTVPMERKLIYIEPTPEKLDPNAMPKEGDEPDALENALAALIGIPGYETIREDLQAVLQRNRRIERVDHLVRQGEHDIDQRGTSFADVELDEQGQVPAWSSLKLSDMVRYYGMAFLPYQRLRVYATTDKLADQLGARWGIDRDSDLQYALRALVRVWREGSYTDESPEPGATVNAFLDTYDFDYRLRRLSFLLRKIDQLTRLLRARQAHARSGQAPAEAPALSEADQDMAHWLPPPFDEASSQAPDLASLETGLRLLRRWKIAMTRDRQAALRWRAELRRPAHFDASLNTAAMSVSEQQHAELKQMLLLILGEIPATTPEDTSDEMRAVLEILRRPQSMRQAAAARTLQEAVVLRASTLFEAAGQGAGSPLYKALVADIEKLRVKTNADDRPETEKAFRRIWELIGAPHLAKGEGDKAALVLAPVKPSDGPDVRSPAGQALRRFFGTYYLAFDTYDQMSFPLYYDTGTGEPATVEVLRISPLDATHLIDEDKDPQHRQKLAGTALAHFGAFLDRRWRLNDIMWGRLDGAERLIEAVLPMADDDTSFIRQCLIEQAQQCILREALGSEGEGQLAALLVDALAALPDKPAGFEIQAVLKALQIGETSQRKHLAGALAGLLDEQGLMNYVRSTRKVDPEPDPASTLKAAVRAVAITGRVLEGISDKHGGTTTQAARWLARLGLLLQGLVAVSLPGTLAQRWGSSGIRAVYAIELFVLLAALLVGNADLRQLMLVTFGLTLATHLLALVIGDITRRRSRWIVIACVVAGVALAGLSFIGLKSLTAPTHPAAQAAPPRPIP